MIFKTLRSRIVGLVILSSVTLAAALALVIGDRVSEDVKTRVGRALVDRAIELGERLDREMASRINEVLLLSSLDLFRSLDRPSDLRDQIDHLQGVIPAFSWVGVLDLNGNVVAATGGILQGRNISHRPVFHEGIRGVFIGDVHDAVLLANLLPNPTGEPMKFVDIAVRLSGHDGKPIGVLAAHLSWNWARTIERETMTRMGDDPSLELFVVAADGSILLAPNRAQHGLKLTLDGVARAQRGEAGWTTATWPDDRRYVTGFAQTRGRDRFESLGWVVLARQPESVAFAPVVALSRQIALIGTGLAIVATLFGWMAASSIIAPLGAIARAADAVRQRRGGSFAGVDGPREIRVVSEAIEDLVDTLTVKDEALAELAVRAARDPLTGLANRAALDRIVADGTKIGTTFAVACIDLDGFKSVNDNHGHLVGDAVLREAGVRLQSCVRGGDIVIRSGGDEFVAILQMTPAGRDGPVLRVGDRIVNEMTTPFEVEGVEVTIGASVGLAIYPRDGDEPRLVLQRADEALYRAKRAGRQRVEMFDEFGRSAAD